MGSKFFLIIFVFGLYSCSSTEQNEITEFKPSLTKDRKEARDSFIGKWESTQPVKNGGNRHTVIERHYDSRYVVEFKITDENGELKKHQKEFGYWGVAGGIYFTMFRGWINDDEFDNADPDNPYYYDSYKIIEITNGKLTYESLSSNNRFIYTKVKQLYNKQSHTDAQKARAVALKRYESIMYTIKLIFLILTLSVVASCSQGDVKPAFLVANDGTQYEVVNKQNMLFDNDKMLVITYISADPDNEKTRNKEFQDLYQITANNINPASDYDYIALVALKKRNKSFGVTKNKGYRDRRAFPDVIALRKNDS